MPRRRTPPGASSPQAPASPHASAEQLEARYRGLLERYHGLAARNRELVARLAQDTGERSSTVTLALSALRASRSAMALVRGGVYLVRNPAWLAIERSSAPWLGTGREYATVDDLGIDQADGMLRAGDVVREARYERDGAQVLHVRCERLARPGPAVVLLLARDVTQRARAEREVARARELMLEQERTRAVGELASGVAHDLNNVLHAMALRLQALRREEPASPRQRDGLQALARMVEDAATRVARLQDLAHRRHDAPEGDVDLATVVREAVETARPELEHGGNLRGAPVAVAASIAPLPRVLGSAAELRHVFLNLLLNARDAMPGGGTVRVSAGARGADRVLVRVEDDGRGIPPEALPRIFDPFFTTKGQRGTGLGLAIARSVMTRLGGDIRAANRDGKGAVFELDFPVSSLARPEPPRAPARPRGRLRVLVVDDDADVLEAARLVLEDLGQEVDTCPSGKEAIARVRGGDRPDVVLCDVGMPEVSGWQVAESLRALAPSTRVFLVTGWAHEIGPDDPRRGLVEGVLPKPLPLESLAAIFGEAPRAEAPAHDVGPLHASP